MGREGRAGGFLQEVVTNQSWLEVWSSSSLVGNSCSCARVGECRRRSAERRKWGRECGGSAVDIYRLPLSVAPRSHVFAITLTTGGGKKKLSSPTRPKALSLFLFFFFSNLQLSSPTLIRSRSRVLEPRHKSPRRNFILPPRPPPTLFIFSKLQKGLDRIAAGGESPLCRPASLPLDWPGRKLSARPRSAQIHIVSCSKTNGRLTRRGIRRIP